MNKRPTKQTLFIGYNSTGKSSRICDILQGYTSKPGRKALIITPDPVEWDDFEETLLTKPSDFVFEGIRRYVWCEDDQLNIKVMGLIKQFYFDGFVVFDDCRSYLDAKVPQWLKYFFIRRRQKKIDLMLVGHGFSDIPPKAFTNCSDLFLFRTKDNFSTRKKDLLNYNELVEHQRRVNSKVLDTTNAWTSSGIIGDNKYYYERIIF